MHDRELRSKFLEGLSEKLEENILDLDDEMPLEAAKKNWQNMR